MQTLQALDVENKRAVPKGRVLWEVEAKCNRFWLAEVGNNLHQDILKRVPPALEKCENIRQNIHNAEALKAYQQYVREAFINSIGGLPALDTPLNPQIVSVQEIHGFILEKIILEPRPQNYMTCNLYRPLRQNGPIPGVVFPIGHTDDGKAFEEYQRVAQMLVSAGFAVLLYDPLGEGERFEHYEPSIELQPIQGCSGEHDMMDWKCKALGLSLARYFVHEGIRAIEYLASRPEVDAARIAVTGHSGGGTQTSMLMAAAADKLAAAAPCSYTSDQQAMIEYGKDPDNEMIWPGIIAAGVDYADIISVMAPKPVLLLTNRYDFFPREGTDRTLLKIQKLWQQIGAEVEPEIARSYTGHSYTPSLGEAVTKFFAKHLMGCDVDLSGFVFHPIAASDLWCTSSGQVIQEFPDMRTLQQELEEEAQAARAALAAKEPAKRRQDALEWLRKAAWGTRKKVEPCTRVIDSGILAHYLYRDLAWKAEEGYFGHGVLLRDMRHGDNPLPTVIAVWPQGIHRIEAHANWIHRTCAKGKQVFVIDLPASGSLLPHLLSNSNMNIGWCTQYTLQAYLLELGDSLMGIRLFHTMQALQVLKELPVPQHEEVSFYGEDEFARYVKIAALLTGTPVSMGGGYQTYTEIVTDKYHDQTHTVDWILPGILQVADMDDIDTYLREDGLLIS